jgi:hypothetical protein
MKLFTSIAVLVTFIAISLSFSTINLPLLGGGIVVAIFVFLALRGIEAEKMGQSNEIKEIVAIMKQQIQHQQETTQSIGDLLKAISNLSTQMVQNHKEILSVEEGMKNDFVAVGEKAVNAINQLKETLPIELNKTSEQLSDLMIESRKVVAEAAQGQMNYLRGLEQKLEMIIEQAKGQFGQSLEVENHQLKELLSIKDSVTKGNSQYEKVIETLGKEFTQLQKNENLVEQGFKNIKAALHQFEVKYENGLIAQSDLTTRLHEQKLAEQQKRNESTSIAIQKHEVALGKLVNQLMEITIEMSESKQVAREQILRMQDAYVKELKKRVRA